MEKLRMCRLCMAEEVRLHNIVNTHLQEMYESLILIPLETTDRRPIQACYICCARLENCYQLRKRGLRSEELFTQMLTADIMQMQTDTRSFRAKRVTGELSNGLASTTVVHLTVGDVPQESRDAGVKLNPPGVLEDPGVRIKEEKDKEALYKSRTQLLEDDQSMELEDASSLDIKEELLSDDEIHIKDELLSDDHTEMCEDVPPNIVKNENFRTNIEDELPTENHTEICEEVPRLEPHVTLSIIGKKELQDFMTNIEDELLCEDASHLKPLDASPNVVKNELQCLMTSAHEAEKICSPTETEGAVDTTSYKLEQTVAEERLNTDKVTVDKLSTHTHNTTVIANHFTNGGRNGLRVYSRLGNKNKFFTCDICLEAFIKKEDLLKHEFNIHPCVQNDECKTEIINVTLKVTDFKEKNYWATYVNLGSRKCKCDECMKYFLYLHMPDRVGKPYQSDNCNNFFTRNHDLNNHAGVESHKIKYFYQRTGCKKSFDRKSELDVHKRVHIGEKPYVCDICEQRYTRKYSLQKHLLAHAGKRYQCNHCNQSFTYKRTLDSHIMSIHKSIKPYHIQLRNGRERFHCNVCNQYFSDKLVLDSHTLVDHDKVGISKM